MMYRRSGCLLVSLCLGLTIAGNISCSTEPATGNVESNESSSADGVSNTSKREGSNMDGGSSVPSTDGMSDPTDDSPNSDATSDRKDDTLSESPRDGGRDGFESTDTDQSEEADGEMIADANDGSSNERDAGEDADVSADPKDATDAGEALDDTQTADDTSTPRDPDTGGARADTQLEDSGSRRDSFRTGDAHDARDASPRDARQTRPDGQLIGDGGSGGVDARPPDATMQPDADARSMPPRNPSLIYVDDSDRLVYLDNQRNKYTTGVQGDIRALGPSLYYDQDSIREIPYAIADGNDGPSLKVVDLTGNVSTLDKDIMGYTSHGRLGVADVNDNQDQDIIYPDDNKSLAAIDQSTGQRELVRTGKNGNNAKPAAFMGAIDDNNDGIEELYWIGTSSNVKYVTQSNLKRIQTPNGGFHVGSNNNIGVGAPRDLNANGETNWAMVNGSNNPGLVPAGGGSFQTLNTQNNATKTPVAFGDVAGDLREEVIFIDSNGKIRYVSTKNPGQSSAAQLLQVQGNDVSADPQVGLVSGYTAFGERL